ncbi:MAG TPA: NAD(P)-binding domain-containing protein [Aggregatilineaceae bacterium]|nr:NAD(P)-binding domain-containing protein [Aggregatilineaceae bacterium]
MKIGYIGLGLMGSAMARNLMKAGNSLVVHNRSQAIVQQLATEGAQVAHSPREVAAQVDVVFTNLPDSPDVEAVVLGKDGIHEGAHPGLIFVDNSTIKPETARHIAAELAKAGVIALDAPVSGGQIGAQQGTLVFMVGGDQAAFEKLEPLFKAMGRSWTLVGDSGAGQIAKAANQIMVAAQMAAMGELMVFAQKCGVDPFRVAEAIKGGAAQCWALDNKPTRLAQGIRTPGFKAYMQLKDLRIVMATGQTYHAPLPLSAVTTNLFESMVNSGNGEQDNAAVVSVYEAQAGTHVGPKG